MGNAGSVEHHKHQEQRERQAKEHAQWCEREARKREEEAKKREAEAKIREEEAKKREEEAKRHAEETRIAFENARKREEELVGKEEESRKRAEEARKMADESRRIAEEAHRREEEALEREKEIKRRAEEERAIAEAEAAGMKRVMEQQEFYLSKGIQPVKWPTEEEIDAAKARVDYRVDRLHFAICGGSGTGKSSLINAIRGLQDSDSTKGAAPTGIIETTLEITAYPDPRDEPPYSRFVWFDVPGAGTLEISDWQYFNQQGLFIFDAIVMVYDDRFTKIDVAILENCRRYHIPVFIVRSKVDHYIRSTMKTLGYTKRRKAEKAEFYTKAQAEVIIATRQNVESNLEKADCLRNEFISFQAKLCTTWSAAKESWSLRSSTKPDSSVIYWK
ncbi:P-loop containing nucleoside triphosphate hydrolase protein [Wilcoxina mikolae CBS 423.85]|nr:P-loop containing nucleoside triphosphate hydrolase protein [Wilcoxina mikolae CBS 423.85]